jgi:uncharacterized protein YdaU (DUF1376 family)
MTKQPRKMTYAPLYFIDFKEGCEDLTNEEIGVYLRVLFEIYEFMGPIKLDDRKLAKRLNCRPHKARSMIESLVHMGKLYLTREGLVSNRRAENEIVKFVSISVQNQLNAKSRCTDSIQVQSRFNRKSVELSAVSPLQISNENNAEDERPRSDREAILDKKNKKDLSSLELQPRALFAPERSQKALEEFEKRRRERSTKKPFIKSGVR